MNIKHRDLHRVVLTAIIHKDGKYLITKRAMNRKAFCGKWTVPGGGLETDDYINTPKTTTDTWYFAVINTLKREVKEEVGLEIDRIRYLIDMTFIRPDGIPIVILSFYCNYKSGDVKLNEESIDYKWIKPEQAKNYDLIGGLPEEIEMTDRILKGEDPDKIEFKIHEPTR